MFRAVQQASSRAREGHSSRITKRSSHFVFAGNKWLKPNEFNGGHGPLVPPYALQVKEDSNSAHTVVNFTAFMSVLAWGKANLCKWERKNVSKGGQRNLLIHLWRELCIVYIHRTAHTAHQKSL